MKANAVYLRNNFTPNQGGGNIGDLHVIFELNDYVIDGSLPNSLVEVSGTYYYKVPVIYKRNSSSTNDIRIALDSTLVNHHINACLKLSNGAPVPGSTTTIIVRDADE